MATPILWPHDFKVLCLNLATEEQVYTFFYTYSHFHSISIRKFAVGCYGVS